MNHVNPLHIGGLLGVIILFLFFLLSSAKEEFKTAKEEFATSQDVAVALSGLKKVYANSTKTSRALDRILSQRSIKEAKLSIKKTKKIYKISAKSLQAKTVRALMGKLLNGSYKITQLKIKRLSESKASLDMEIQL